MAWSDVRARLVSDLAGVSITTPTSQTIKRVYEFPPLNLEDFPCFVIFMPAVTVERGPNNRRLKTYVPRIRLYLKDENLATASAYLEAYREAVLDMFDTEVALGNAGNVVNILGPEILEPGAVFYNDQQFIGQDFLLTIRVRDIVTFGH